MPIEAAELLLLLEMLRLAAQLYVAFMINCHCPVIAQFVH
jgi:hypothetical protein